MKRLHLSLVLPALFIVFFAVPPAHAQWSIPRYRPARPPLNAYLSLGHQDSGPLGAYLTYVLPELELRSTLRRQESAISRQGASIRYLGEEMGDAERASAGHPVTGTGSMYMNYSHYYPSWRRFDRRR